MPIYALNDHQPEFSDEDPAWVAPNASVIGQVCLGKRVSIWFGAVVRGDNDAISIGDGSNIQDGVIVHVDPGYPVKIGTDCTIGHNAIIHGCTIEDGALIGMGATILNGAVIGENSLVGANALVTEGKVFPPRSLIVGSPARAIKTLDGAATERLRQSSESYSGKRTIYRDQLVEVAAKE